MDFIWTAKDTEWKPKIWDKLMSHTEIVCTDRRIVITLEGSIYKSLANG